MSEAFLPEMDVSGKKVIVTGGVRGLGRSMVDRLVLAGALVTVFDLDVKGLAELKEKSATIDCVSCDVSIYDEVAAATDKYHEQRGAPEVLINNAGILYSEPLIKLTGAGVKKHDPSMWNKVLAADLSSVFYMTSCIVAKMVATRTKGIVVNISSISAAGNPGASAYSAAKAGVNALTVSWARELGPLGIRVIAIAPGFMETESTRGAVSEAVLNETIKRVPLRRLGRPEELAEAVIRLIQDDFFNGKVFEFDGGLVI